MKVAVFGSAFNPPTRGHLDAIDYVLNDKYGYSRIALIPAYQHAFEKAMLDYVHRVELVARFADDINDERVQALPIEHQLAEGDNPVYTYDVLTYLQDTVFPQDQLTFIMGPDNKKNWHKFYKSLEIDAKWNTLVVPERKPVRSTQVRKAIASGQDICTLVTPSVAKYIQAKKLYK